LKRLPNGNFKEDHPKIINVTLKKQLMWWIAIFWISKWSRKMISRTWRHRVGFVIRSAQSRKPDKFRKFGSVQTYVAKERSMCAFFSLIDCVSVGEIPMHTSTRAWCSFNPLFGPKTSLEKPLKSEDEKKQIKNEFKKPFSGIKRNQEMQWFVDFIGWFRKRLKTPKKKKRNYIILLQSTSWRKERNQRSKGSMPKEIWKYCE
jgi:hypothetical protein